MWRIAAGCIGGRWTVECQAKEWRCGCHWNWVFCLIPLISAKAILKQLTNNSSHPKLHTVQDQTHQYKCVCYYFPWQNQPVLFFVFLKPRSFVAIKEASFCSSPPRRLSPSLCELPFAFLLWSLLLLLLQATHIGAICGVKKTRKHSYECVSVGPGAQPKIHSFLPSLSVGGGANLLVGCQFLQPIGGFEHIRGVSLIISFQHSHPKRRHLYGLLWEELSNQTGLHLPGRDCKGVRDAVWTWSWASGTSLRLHQIWCV